jgi:hypothetical protein
VLDLRPVRIVGIVAAVARSDHSSSKSSA